jgi:hypothetical protein
MRRCTASIYECFEAFKVKLTYMPLRHKRFQFFV